MLRFLTVATVLLTPLLCRLSPDPEPVRARRAPGLPPLLSETGLFASVTGHVVAGDLVPYRINASFWSDGAEKLRYLRLPPGAKLGFRQDGAWRVPIGTELVKTFYVIDDEGRTRFIETRVIRRDAQRWEAGSYVWDEDQTEARLTVDGDSLYVNTETTTQLWRFPSRAECAACHDPANGFVLGLATAQMNGPIERAAGTVNQLDDLVTRELLSVGAAFTEDLPALPDPADESAPLEARARAYLAVNCAVCHRPGGPGRGGFDLGFDVPLHLTQAIRLADDWTLTAGVVVPGSPERSPLLQRMHRLDRERMPPVGSLMIDEEGVELLDRWIRRH